MSLSLYNKKRNFSDTPEPSGKEKSSKDRLRFVVQKHDASHLHYDFRLELRGVLKSWAVPKGPSLKPADKRLAMAVEDHPYDYRTFEGVIPEGNYGGGTVIVWDEGFYEPAEDAGSTRKEQESALMRQYMSGSMKIVLHGKKLNGTFSLRRLGSEEKSWLLIKSNDEFASDEDVADQVASVKSGKTIAQVAAANGTTPHHPEAQPKAPAKGASKAAATKAAAKKAPAKAAAKKAAGKQATAKSEAAKKTAAPKKSAAAKTATRKKKAPDVTALLGDRASLALEAPMPHEFKPMLATLVDQPFSSDQWLYEIKWDGYRAVAEMQGGSVELISRNLKPFTERYEPVADALRSLDIDAVFDGEIIAVDDKGLANFQLLQNWQNAPVQLQYSIFDIVWLHGYDLTALPLVDRKALLRNVVPEDHAILKYSDHVTGDGESFFKAALEQGLEGIMAKKADSTYAIGARTEDWLKVKVNQRQEVVIAGFTQPRNTRKYFGALLLGAFQDGELTYVGHTGSGFNTKSLEAIYTKLQPLVVEDCPFAKCPKGNMPVTWVKPRLVCEIKFTEWTKDWIARHPIFMGLRTDKKATDVIIEKSKNMAMVKKTATKKTAAAKSAAKAAPKKAAAPKSASRAGRSPKAKPGGKQLSLDDGTDQHVLFGKQELHLTSLDKLYWPEEGVRKIDLVNYYSRIAPYILPYMKDRPQSLHRHPNGIGGQHFFQKDMGGKIPAWIPTHRDFSESTGQNVDYLVCNDEETLVYMANMGCIEMHPWHSRTESWQRPDWCLIDLDPEGIGFDKVIECAQVVKKVLDSIGAASYPKTSGSTGIHIYIPLGAKYDYNQSKQFAELVVTLVNSEIPDYTSLERSPSKRRNKVYLDYLQNRETQTAAAPYSMRPKPGVPVSTPLHWDEVKKGLTPTTYNMTNIFDRLTSEGDLFKPVLGKGIDLGKVLKKLGA
ncbi:MAG: ligase [Flaviaesturariibacter sp.]|nr:ligase [Flaviaesturariibacter sp.]